MRKSLLIVAIAVLSLPSAVSSDSGTMVLVITAPRTIDLPGSTSELFVPAGCFAVVMFTSANELNSQQQGFTKGGRLAFLSQSAVMFLHSARDDVE